MRGKNIGCNEFLTLRRQKASYRARTRAIFEGDRICAMNPVLSVHDLSLDYRLSKDKRVQVLQGTSLTIGRGEAVGLLGPSGCGKTSLVRCILGMPMSGADMRCAALQFEDRNLLTMTARERHALRRNRIGVIFQDPRNRLSPFRRIRSQIEDVSPPRYKRIETLHSLSSVGLADPERIASSYPHELSGGECQRIAIAQALVSKPSLLLADEPSSALDTVAQRHILDLLIQVRAQYDLAMLVISHDPALLQALVDRILVLRNGVVADYVPPRAKSFLTHMAIRKELTETARPLLEISNLHLVHGSRRGWQNWLGRRRPHPALQGVSLGVLHGECVAVVGASGSGKSTLARCIAGIDLPQSGVMSFSGTPLVQTRPLALRARLQLILQDTVGALNPRLTVAQILGEPLHIHRQYPTNRHTSDTGSSETLQRIKQVLAAVSLTSEYLERRPPQLSGGERQRVAIARALILQPSLLLLDEALTGLDHELQHSILELLEILRAQIGLTCIHFSHDLGQMLLIADQIAVMDEGRIVESHPAAEFPKLACHPASLQLLDAMLTKPEERR